MSKKFREIVSEVLAQEGEALVKLSKNPPVDLSQVIELLLRAKGKIVFTGVGKSGLVARKIAATFSSLGTPAIFLHPTEAYHGDLGIMSPGDVCVAISHSGKTEEILRLVPSLKLLDIPLVAICSNRKNEISQVATYTLDTQVDKEACAIELAPTTSTTVTMALGDALAAAIVQAKGFTQRDFAFFHPGGTLGRKLLTRVSDVMISSENIGSTLESENVMSLTERMSMSNLGIVVVLNSQKKVVGVVTDGDLRRAMKRSDFQTLSVSAVMGKHPKTVQKDRLITEALREAEKHRITALVVTGENGEYVGAVNLYDMIHDKVF